MTGWSRNGGARLLVVMTTGALAALLFVACGGSSGSQSADRTTTSPPPTTTAPLPDVAPTAADFVNINTMKRVGDHFIGSLNGHLDAVLAVARKPQGGVYPVGTVIQLIPTEAMVKRHKGYSPATGDWEFFALDVSPAGTKISSSGAKVKNFLRRLCVVPRRGPEDLRLRVREGSRLRPSRRHRCPDRDDPESRSPPEALTA